MNLKIFTEPVEEKKEVCLRLVEDEFSNGKKLVACDSQGKTIECGVLLIVNDNGTSHRLPCVNTNLGFSLDRDGCIKDV